MGSIRSSPFFQLQLTHRFLHQIQFLYPPGRSGKPDAVSRRFAMLPIVQPQYDARTIFRLLDCRNRQIAICLKQRMHRSLTAFRLHLRENQPAVQEAGILIHFHRELKSLAI